MRVNEKEWVFHWKNDTGWNLFYKTLRIDANLTVNDAVKFISETLNIPTEKNIGLYLPDERRWLDDNTPLSTYESLQDVEHIEYKSKTQPSENKSCPCIIV